MADSLPCKKTVFPNGLRLIHIPMAQSLTTTVLILVGTGWEYETKDINGISHFLEHLCFKGTKKRPTNQLLAAELDSLGAIYNAFTSNEVTGYFAKASNKNFKRIFDIVSDLYLDPLFDSREMDKERGVVLEEINMDEDLPMKKVEENFLALLYGDQPAGRPGAGTKETIKKISRDDVLSYRRKHYIASKSLVVVAGGTDEDVESLTKEYFSGLASGEPAEKSPIVERQTAVGLHIQTKTTDQTHLVLGVRTFDIFDSRRYVLEVLNQILGGSMSSRLFEKIRNKMGVAYYVHSFAELSRDHGFFGATTGVDTRRLDEAVKALLEEFKNLAQKPVPQAELQKAKDCLSGKLVLGLETSDGVASFYGQEEIITGRIETPEEILENIRRVAAREILEIARSFFKEEKLNLAIIGPKSDPHKLRSLLESGLS